jgi:DNA polymerase V
MRRGTGYKKAGVMLTDLVSENRPATFFEAPKEKREKEKGLLKAVDSINSRWGRGTLRWAAAGSDKKKFWEVRREKTSPAYTTKWEDLPVARIG